MSGKERREKGWKKGVEGEQGEGRVDELLIEKWRKKKKIEMIEEEGGDGGCLKKRGKKIEKSTQIKEIFVERERWKNELKGEEGQIDGRCRNKISSQFVSVYVCVC